MVVPCTQARNTGPTICKALIPYDGRSKLIGREHPVNTKQLDRRGCACYQPPRLAFLRNVCEIPLITVCVHRVARAVANRKGVWQSVYLSVRNSQSWPRRWPVRPMGLVIPLAIQTKMDIGTGRDKADGACRLSVLSFMPDKNSFISPRPTGEYWRTSYWTRTIVFGAWCRKIGRVVVAVVGQKQYGKVSRH